MDFGPRVIFSIGPVYVTETVCFAWLVSLAILVFAFFATRNMQKIPRGIQNVGELLVGFMYNFVKGVMGDVSEKFTPYIGTLFVFLGLGSMLGLIHMRPITADLNCTVPLALVTFIMIHYNAIKVQTFPGYMKELASPYAFMWPLNIVSDCIFPVTLACRIFGNILAGVIVMTLIYGALANLTAGLIPIPFLQIVLPLPLALWFDMFEPILQSYVFCMLTMVFIDNGRHPSRES